MSQKHAPSPSAAEFPREEPTTQSRLFIGENRANAILARSFFNEMIKSGRSRGDMIDFVNCLLGLISQFGGRKAGATAGPLVDPETGIPTRAALHELVNHELDLSGNPGRSAALLVMRVRSGSDLLIGVQLLQHQLRRGDVVAPLRSGLVGGLLYTPFEAIPAIQSRISARLVAHPEFGRVFEGLAIRPLSKGVKSRAVWTEALRAAGYRPAVKAAAE